jgi:hypothetical protein
MSLRVALVRTDVSEELSATINRVIRIGELGTLPVTSNRARHEETYLLLVTANVVPTSPILVTLMMEEQRSTERSVLTGATRRNILEDGILQTCYGIINLRMAEQKKAEDEVERRL